jgi:hypothetical protein
MMGGNALAALGARRFLKAEYLPIRDEVLKILQPWGAEEIPWYSEKESLQVRVTKHTERFLVV